MKLSFTTNPEGAVQAFIITCKNNIENWKKGSPFPSAQLPNGLTPEALNDSPSWQAFLKETYTEGIQTVVHAAQQAHMKAEFYINKPVLL